MKCLVNLQGSFCGLDDAEKDSEHKYHYSDPESVPLGPTSSVPPPLPKCLRRTLIELLLQNAYPVFPIIKVVYQSIFRPQGSVLRSRRIKTMLVSMLLVPEPNFGIRRRKEEVDGLQSLVYEVLA